MKYLIFGLLAIALFISFDHMMRVDQQNMCERTGEVPCPTGEWIWN